MVVDIWLRARWMRLSVEMKWIGDAIVRVIGCGKRRRGLILDF